MVPFIPIALLFMGWCIADIIRQPFQMRYKIMLIAGTLLLTVLGVLIYYLWLKPWLKRDML